MACGDLNACIPGSYSADGVYPCSPCERGRYSTTYGQTNCQPCKGGMTTAGQGSEAESYCEEFDIVFPRGSNGSVYLALSSSIDFIDDLTLKMWFRFGYTKNASQPRNFRLGLANSEGNEVISVEGFNVWTSYFSGYLQVLDDRWHFLSVKSFNCNVEVGLDLDIIKTQSTFVACGFKNFSTVTLTSDANADVAISQLHLWHEKRRSNELPRCSISDSGDVLQWQQFGDADLDGAYIDFPSLCDDYDNCVASPCLNGICSDALDGYSCECQPGYSGKNCEINVDDCLENICTNGATCEDGVLGYSCLCPILFTGELCETEIVHGKWSEPSDWTECSVTCGTGFQQRERLCNNPEPRNGGNICKGENLETRECQTHTACPVCKELQAPENGYLNCTNVVGTWNCTLSCIHGYDLDIAPVTEFICGPDTFHVWNFETEFNPERRLPHCVEIQPPKEVSVSYSGKYKDLYCIDEEIEATAVKEITSQVMKLTNTLTCISNGACVMENFYIIDCQYNQPRQKREVVTAGFKFSLVIYGPTSETSESVISLEESHTKIVKLAENGNFTIDVKRNEHELDQNRINSSLDLVCEHGLINVNYYCLPCGKGAFVKDGECRRCLLGTYQDTVGQTACKSCPDGQTTIGEGSESIQDCTGERVVDNNNSTPIVIAVCVPAGTIVLFVGISVCVYRRKTRAKVISKDVHSDKKTNYKKSHCTKLGQSKPDFKTCRPTHFTQMQANKEP